MSMSIAAPKKGLAQTQLRHCYFSSSSSMQYGEISSIARALRMNESGREVHLQERATDRTALG